MEYTVIKLDPELGRRIKIRAAETGVTMKEIVAEAMNTWLKDPEPIRQDPVEDLEGDEKKTRGVQRAALKMQERGTVAARRTAA